MKLAIISMVNILSIHIRIGGLSQNRVLLQHSILYKELLNHNLLAIHNIDTTLQILGICHLATCEVIDCQL